MNKNGFKALLIHVAIGIITFALFTGLDSLAVDNKIKYADATYKTGVILIFLLVSILYLLAGKVLAKQETTVRDVLSVSGVAITGLCLWLACFFTAGGTIIGASLEWVPFIFYILYAMPVITTFHIDSAYIGLLFVIVPSLLMWISLQLWNRQNKK